MFTCNLTKLESAVEQVRKSYPKLKPTEVALLASALVLSGRHAVAVYEGEHYTWPEDYQKLTKAMVAQIEIAQESIEPPKKSAKAQPEEEPVVLTVGLIPNYTAGEERLGSRKRLKTTLSQIMEEGIEFVYSATDVGWQWALDRANWNTVSGGELARRVKVKAIFSEGAVGVQMGPSGRKRAPKPKAKDEAPKPKAKDEAPKAKEEAPKPKAKEEAPKPKAKEETPKPAKKPASAKESPAKEKAEKVEA